MTKHTGLKMIAWTFQLSTTDISIELYNAYAHNLSYVKFRDVFEKIYVLYHPLSAYPLMHDLTKSRGTSRALTIKVIRKLPNKIIGYT